MGLVSGDFLVLSQIAGGFGTLVTALFGMIAIFVALSQIRRARVAQIESALLVSISEYFANKAKIETVNSITEFREPYKGESLEVYGAYMRMCLADVISERKYLQNWSGYALSLNSIVAQYYKFETLLSANRGEQNIVKLSQAELMSDTQSTINRLERVFDLEKQLSSRVAMIECRPALYGNQQFEPFDKWVRDPRHDNAHS
jgi:hypothetical protein